jgi:guanine nucleotide-binding protein subunit alpha
LNLIRCDFSRALIRLNEPLYSSIKKILETLQLVNDSPSAEGSDEIPLTTEHRRLALSLSPLLAFETTIAQMIASEGSAGGYTVVVRPGGGWKDKLAAFSGRAPSSSPESGTLSLDESGTDPHHVTHVLAACKNEIIELWRDPIVRSALESCEVRLHEEPGL